MGERPLFILAGNGAYENRGCEAIVRGTVEILRKSYDHPYFLSVTHFDNPAQYLTQRENEYDSDISHTLLYNPVGRLTIPWFRRLFIKMTRRHYNLLKSGTWRKELLQSRAVLSVGGDNYSLDYGIPIFHIDLDDYVFDNKKPLIIWGASIGPFSKLPDFELYMKEHLKKATAIFVREPVSIEYLNDLGFSDNVFRVADPAFILPPREPSPEKMNIPILEGAVGLNISPLMAKYSANGKSEEWTQRTAAIIEHVADTLKRPLYLIPHVTIPHSNDYMHMRDAFSILTKRDDIYLVPPVLSAQEIKWFIGKMAAFAGARTHSTIAAISQGVPTLTFSYSIKAYGINTDIFNDTQYCLNADHMLPGVIAERLADILQNSGEIKEKIRKQLPHVQQLAYQAGDYLHQVLGDRS